MVTEVNVRCSPTNIPENLEVDITNLNIGKSIAVGDLDLLEGIKVEDDPNKIILGIVAPKKKE
jgi:large subunit ribosomal protein L25